MSSHHLAALAYLGVLLTTGYALYCALAGRMRRHPLEIAGASGLLGAAAVPLLLFWLSLAGLAPRRGLLAGIFLASLAAIAWFARRGRLVLPESWRPRLRWFDLWGLPFLAPILWIMQAATTQALGYALIDWDGFATWGFRAKALYLDALPDLHGYFHDLTLSFATQDHPLLLPFLTAGSYAAMGGVYDQVGKSAVLFIFWSFVLFQYGAARSLLPRVFALAVTAATLCTPAVLRWAVQGTPDLPLAAFYSASLFFVVGWIAGGSLGQLWLAGFFSVACAFTKSEGVPLAAINFLALAVCGWKRQRHFARDFATVAATCALLLLPWLVFRHGLPHTNENYAGRLSWAEITSHSDRLPVIFAFYIARMFFDWNWCPFWFLVFGVYLVADWSRPSWEARLLLILLLAHLAAYVVAYTITPYSLSALLAETLDRLYLHLLPAGAWLVIYSLRGLWQANSLRLQLEPET